MLAERLPEVASRASASTCPQRLLSDRQVEHFEGRWRVLAWDATEHAASRPFDLCDKARSLDGILVRECMDATVVVGRSIGGFAGETYAQLFRGRLRRFVAIDSAPRSGPTSPQPRSGCCDEWSRPIATSPGGSSAVRHRGLRHIHGMTGG